MQDGALEHALAFVAKELGEDMRKLRLETTLQGDLGMEGDDAVEFFQAFQKEFGVDLGRLWTDWHCYFLPEGMSIETGLILFVPGTVLSLLLTKYIPQISSWLCFLIGFFLWLVVCLAWGRLFSGPGLAQITIHDLVECVKSGSWKREVPEAVKRKFAVKKDAAGHFG